MSKKVINPGLVPKNFIPTGSRMLCQRVSDVVSDLIIIPDEVKEGSMIFVVLEKGPGCIDDSIEVGNYVYVGRFAPCHIAHPANRHWYTVREVDVLGTVTEFTEVDL